MSTIADAHVKWHTFTPTLPHERRETPLAARIRDGRNAMGISQSELGRRAGLTPSFICRVEEGARGMGPVSLMKVSIALAIPFSELVEARYAMMIMEAPE